MTKQASVAVVGQGYVGLSLACAAADAGYDVVGIDVDGDRVGDLSAGRLTVPGVSEEAFRSASAGGSMRFTTDMTALSDTDIVIICVPTPVRDHTPDLSFVETACRSTAEHMKAGQMVVLESTTYPGTTEELVRPLLEESGLLCGNTFLLAYSPERIDPGNSEYTFREIPRIVGGITPEATGAVSLFYGQLVDKVFVASSTRAAELAKLLENTFRHVNIALVNELSMLCNETGIDVWEVIDAAATKPFGFMPFHPGPGVGGHCIPLDPAYLAWQVRRDAGHQFRILELAQDVNAQMPTYVANRISQALNVTKRCVNEANILVLGVSYKPDVGDVRESPSLKVMNLLYKWGAKVTFHDPYVDEVAVNGGTMQRSDLTLRAVENADIVALLTPHHAYDLDWIASHASLVFDARNAYAEHSQDNVVSL